MIPVLSAFFLLVDMLRRRFALPVEAVERIVAAAETVPLAEPCPAVRGLVNVGGAALPVVDLRPAPGGLFPDLELSDRFVLLREGGRLVALLVEGLAGVVELDVDVVALPGDGPSRQVSVAFEGDEASAVLVRSPEALLRGIALSEGIP